MSRPSETASAAIGSIVGAVLAILAAYDINVPAAVGPAVIILVGWVAAAVTWFIAKKQRIGQATSGADGTVG